MTERERREAKIEEAENRKKQAAKKLAIDAGTTVGVGATSKAVAKKVTKKAKENGKKVTSAKEDFAKAKKAITENKTLKAKKASLEKAGKLHEKTAKAIKTARKGGAKIAAKSAAKGVAKTAAKAIPIAGAAMVAADAVELASKLKKEKELKRRQRIEEEKLRAGINRQ